MQNKNQGLEKQKVFGELYDEFLPKIYRYLNFKVIDEQITEDLTSTVFEKALINFEKYNKDKATFSTWIFSIARNTLTDYYRTNKSQRHVPLDEAIEIPSRNPTPQEEAERNAEKEILKQSIAELPEDYQEIIRLKFSAELNNRQIANILGLTESNVGVKLFRAISRLREDFNESWNG